MIVRSRWLSALVSLSVIGSMGLIGVTAASASNAGKAHVGKTHSQASIPVRCKSRTKASGTIKYSDWQFPDTLNGDQSSLAVTTETLDSMFVGLWRFDSKAKFRAVMATAIPSLKNGGITNGGKTVTVHLKKGMLWSTGQEITSKDMKFGFAVDSDKLSGPACSGSCDVISRIDTPDKYTIVFHLKQAYAPFLQNGIPEMWPSKVSNKWNGDPHAAANVIYQDPTYNFESASPDYPTSGPYQVNEFIKDDRVTLAPMPKYNVTNCGAGIKNLIFAFYSSKAGMIAAAAARQTDVTQNYTVYDLPQLKQHTDAYHLHADPGFIIEHMELNTDATYNGKPNPLANLKVRQALALALDKSGLIRSALSVNATQANAVGAWTFLVNTPALVQPFADKALKGQWDPIQKKYDSNTGKGKALADAKKLMQQAGFGTGFTLDFFTTSGNPVRAAAESVAASNWAKIGVTVNPSFVSATSLFADWDHQGVADHGNFQVLMFAYLGAPDPDSFKYNMQSKYVDRAAAIHNSINSNDAGINNAKINAAYNAAAKSLDSKVRAKNYAIVQEQVNQNAYWIPLYFRPTIVTEDGKVSNFANNPTSSGPEWNTFDWRTKAG